MSKPGETPSTPTYKDRLLNPVRSRLRDAQQELDLISGLLEHLPDLPYAAVYGHAYKADLSVKFEVEAPADIIPLLAALPPLPLVMVKDSCLSFHPEGGAEQGQVTQVFGLLIRAENVARAGVTAAWFAELANGQRVSVKAEVKQAHQWVRWSGQKRMSDGAVYWADEGFSHRFGASPRIVRWGKGSPEYLGSYTLYWPRETNVADILTPTANAANICR